MRPAGWGHDGLPHLEAMVRHRPYLGWHRIKSIDDDPHNPPPTSPIEPTAQVSGKSEATGRRRLTLEGSWSR